MIVLSKGLVSEDLSKVKVLGAFLTATLQLILNVLRARESLRRKLTEFSGTYLTTYTLPPPIHPQLAYLRTVQSSPPQLLSMA